MNKTKRMRSAKRVKKAKSRMKNEKSMNKINKLEMMMFINFPQIIEDASIGVIQDDEYFERVLRCENCEKYKARSCIGENRQGERVLDCLSSKMEDGEWGSFGRLPFSLN